MPSPAPEPGYAESGYADPARSSRRTNRRPGSGPRTAAAPT